MNIRQETLENGAFRLRIEGEMTIYNAAAVKTGVLEGLSRATAIEIDLTSVTELDTSGVQLLFLARREAERNGKGFRIQAASPQSMNILKLLNVTEHLGI